MNRYRKKISIPVAGACAVLFAGFSLLFLTWQSDVLMFSQKVLSGGLTTYSPLLGTSLLTVALLLLSWLLYRFLLTNLYFLPALFFLPSLLILATLTDGRITPSGGLEEGPALPWLIAVSLILLLVSLVLRRVKFIADVKTPLELSKSLFINILLMGCFFFLTTVLSNTSRKDHVHLLSERLVAEGKYDEAVQLIDRNNVLDAHSVMIKAFALNSQGHLADHFFEHPLPKVSSKSLFPSPSNPLLIIRASMFYKNWRNPDYRLLSSLLDRNLPEFAQRMTQVYGDTIPQLLPRYYKEALICYKHTSAQPSIVFTDDALEENFSGFRELKGSARRDSYGDTYWYYYFLKQ